MSCSIDGRGVEFMRLEAMLKKAVEASSETCWHKASREVADSVLNKKISDMDAKTLEDDYPKPESIKPNKSYSAEEIYFFKKLDLEFSVYIDDLVTSFNAVAIDKDQPADVKEFLLKKIFDRLTDIAIMEVSYAVHNTDNIGQSINRTTHVLDIMMDDANNFAPDLVRHDVLDKARGDEGHQWHALAIHREENAEHLRTMLKAFYQMEAVMREQQTAQQPSHSTHSGTKFVPQLAGQLDRRTAPSPDA